MTLKFAYGLCLTFLVSFAAHAADFGDSFIQQRHHVVCGIDQEYRLLAHKKEGRWQGFDADICRAVAAAIIGDAESFELSLEKQASLDRFLAVLAPQG